MQKKLLILLLLFSSSKLWAQNYTLPVSLISSGGGMGQTSINGGTANVEWTLGETFIYGGNLGTTVLSNDEQQINVGYGVGFNEIFFSALNIYPNPTNQNFYIKAENGDQLVNVLIYDLFGQLVLTKKNHQINEIIQTNNLTKGLYLVNIQSANSNSTAHIKFNKLIIK